MAVTIITRAEAKAQGLTKFFTGEPCDRGHVAERYISGGMCIPCRLEQNERWRLANLEKKAAGHTAWMAKNAEHFKAQQKVYHAQWYAENRERKQAASKALRDADPEKARAAAVRYTRKWQVANPEKTKALLAKWLRENPDHAKALAASKRSRRRARKKGNGGTHTAADLREILAAQDHRCVLCAADLRQVKRHLDHIKPLARGGSNGRENLQYLCAPCNLRKGAKERTLGT